MPESGNTGSLLDHRPGDGRRHALERLADRDRAGDTDCAAHGRVQVIAVPAASAIGDMRQLVEAFRRRPEAFAWGGGSAGGTDHILAGLIAEAAGVDPRRVNYVAFSGGGEAVAALLGGHVAAGDQRVQRVCPARPVRTSARDCDLVAIQDARDRRAHDPRKRPGRRNGELARRSRRRRAVDGRSRAAHHAGEPGSAQPRVAASPGRTGVERPLPRRGRIRRTTSPPSEPASGASWHVSAVPSAVPPSPPVSVSSRLRCSGGAAVACAGCCLRR